MSRVRLTGSRPDLGLPISHARTTRRIRSRGDTGFRPGVTTSTW